jgi:hypothetical protein
MIERIMRAANDAEISLYTSIITVAEILHLGTKPPPPELKPYVERLILSGRNGIIAIAPSPLIRPLGPRPRCRRRLMGTGCGSSPCGYGPKRRGH